MATGSRVPELRAGDRLTRVEFERRYEASPHVKKAELLEGVVYMPSPVRHPQHGEPHSMLATWLGTYQWATPGMSSGIESTWRVDQDNATQPDLLLRRLGSAARSRVDADGYIEGPPELVVEVAASSASYDLHQKLHVYRRAGVQEYVVLRSEEGGLDWFALRGGHYQRLASDPDGVLRSEVFPGLWLDVSALLRADTARLEQALRAGLASPEHAAFVARLAR
jgi:Uma2 family endonuclease